MEAADAKETERLRKLKKSESGKRRRARINAALDALPAASGAAAPAPLSRFSGAAAREPQGGALGSWPGRALAIRSAREPEADTFDEDVGTGVPSRYHVSNIIVTGPRRPALPHTGLHTQKYTVPAKRALLENTLREFEQAFDRRCATSRDQSSFDVRASGAGRAAGGSGRRVLEGGAGGAARYERASFEKMMDEMQLRKRVLGHFTKEDAQYLLAPASRQLAASVRDPDQEVLWKTLPEFKFSSGDSPDEETVHELFKQAYPFYRRDKLDPFAAMLLMEICQSDYSAEEKWAVILKCVPHEANIDSVDQGHTPEEVTEAYKIWLANQNRRWDVSNMEILSKKIERNCLVYISPPCWQYWKSPPEWYEGVQLAFSEWQAKLRFQIDLRKFHKWSVLARMDEESFEKVKKKMDRDIRQKKFENWNQFAYALLKECNNHYMVPDDGELNGDFQRVSGDFERAEGDDFEDPDCDDE